MRALTADTFAAEVLDSPVPVVVDFWAPWCGPCRSVGTILGDLAARYEGRIVVAKLNVDEHPTVAARYAVLSLPTAILFADGEPQQSVIGARPRSHYERAWAGWLAA